MSVRSAERARWWQRPVGLSVVGVAVLAGVLLLPQATPTSAAFSDTSSVGMDVRTPSANPVGAMVQHLGGEVPDGWVAAEGQELSRAGYPDLFEVIGTTYGAGDGVSTFNLPDLRGRTPVGLSPDEGEFAELGQAGGSKTHELTVDEMPAHSHGARTDEAGRHNHAITVNSGGAHTHTATTGSAGSHRHNALFVGSQRITWQSEMKQTGRFGSPHGNANGVNILTDTAGAHTHSVTVRSGGAHTHSASSSSGGAHSHGVTVEVTGGGEGHNNVQPYVTVNFIVRAK